MQYMVLISALFYYKILYKIYFSMGRLVVQSLLVALILFCHLNYIFHDLFINKTCVI